MTTHLFQQWLTSHFQSADTVITPLAGDASFRRYYRVRSQGSTWIAVDASAEREKCHQFIAIANAFRQKGLCTPEIFASDIPSGYMLLSDLGDHQLLTTVNANNREKLYSLALDSLAVIATCKQIEGYTLPLFTAQFMREELAAFQEWFLQKYLGLTLSTMIQQKLAELFDLIAERCAAQPYVVMHRDYHSANLMVLSQDRIGILDFQDAFIGPVTYDLASLLRDCYMDLPQESIVTLALQYRDRLALSVSDTEFLSWFDCMGVQRHLKALLTFSRKYCRDNNAHYLQFVPRTLHYVLKVTARYPEFAVLHDFLEHVAVEKTIHIVQ